jgi:hypothetical protein
LEIIIQFRKEFPEVAIIAMSGNHHMVIQRVSCLAFLGTLMSRHANSLELTVVRACVVCPSWCKPSLTLRSCSGSAGLRVKSV